MINTQNDAIDQLTSLAVHLTFYVSCSNNSQKLNPQTQTIPYPYSTGGYSMSEFDVTTLAVEKLKEYMEQNNIDSALRVALMQGG